MAPMRQVNSGDDFGQGNPIDSWDGRLRDMLMITIDEVIVAGWRVLENGFNENAFQDWRLRAQDCFVALCGESHPYMDYFRTGVQQARTSSVLTGVGLLVAVQWGTGTVLQRKGENNCAIDDATLNVDRPLNAS